MSDEKKLWYQSTTIQGDIIVVIGLLVRVLDMPILEDEIKAIVSALVTVIGIVMVFIGRFKAKKVVGFSKK